MPCLPLCYSQSPHPHRRSLLTRGSTGETQSLKGRSGSVSCGVSGSWCTQDFVCALQESVSPGLCKFWWLYGGVNSHLLQEGSCHLQVCYTQSPCPCGRPLLTCASTGDTQHSKVGLAQSLWGLWALVHTRFCFV